jgi:hypothetical protein
LPHGGAFLIVPFCFLSECAVIASFLCCRSHLPPRACPPQVGFLVWPASRLSWDTWCVAVSTSSAAMGLSVSSNTDISGSQTCLEGGVSSPPIVSSHISCHRTLSASVSAGTCLSSLRVESGATGLHQLLPGPCTLHHASFRWGLLSWAGQSVLGWQGHSGRRLASQEVQYYLP